MEKTLILIMTSYYFYIIGLMYYMFTQRKAAVKEGVIRASYFKTYLGDSPPDLQVLHNHVVNQFQLPVIFFVACVLNLQQNTTNLLTIGVALLFIVSRLIHTKIHLGSNHLIQRAMSFLAGALLIGVLFLIPVFMT